VAWSPTMFTSGVLARRALCRFARPLARPGPQVQQRGGRLAGDPSVAIGCASHDAFERHSTERICGTESSAATKCISEVPGLPKQTSTSQIDQGLQQGLGAVHCRSPCQAAILDSGPTGSPTPRRRVPRRCQPRSRQTRVGAASVWAPSSVVTAAALFDLAAEHPVRVRGVHEDDRIRKAAPASRNPRLDGGAAASHSVTMSAPGTERS